MPGFNPYSPSSYNHRVKKSSEVVLLDFCDWSITLREALFSLLMIGVLVLIGFLVSNAIDESENNKVLRYRQAVALCSDEEFQHAISTDVGDVFASGILSARSPITNEHIKGEGFLRVGVLHQEHRMHTQHYTTVDNKGKVHHHVRHYWSWDTMSSDEHHSPEVEYCGVVFPYDKFSYSLVGEDMETFGTGFNRRDVVYTMKPRFNATIFCTMDKGTIAGGYRIVLNEGVGIEEYRERLCSRHGVMIFWIMWSIFSIFVVVMFLYAENTWLEEIRE